MPSSRNEARDWLCYGKLKFFLGHPVELAGSAGSCSCCAVCSSCFCCRGLPEPSGKLTAHCGEDPVVEAYVPELLLDDDRVLVDDSVGAVVDLIALGVGGPEEAVLGEEVSMPERDGALQGCSRS